MCFFLILAAEILLAAMAVFGLYCAVFLLCGERGGKYKTAIRIQNINDIRSLESMILQADTSFFSSRREKYALLVDYELDEEAFEFISESISDRVELYRHIDKKEKNQ
jgi:hypothetical protein